MEAISQYHQFAAVLIARLILGFLFFFQGYDAVFNVKIKNVTVTFQNTFRNRGIPLFLTACASWLTSCTALIGGLFVIFGMFEYGALYLLGINLIVAAIGFGINTPMWDTRFVLLRLILVLFLLVVPAQWNAWSLDNLFFK